MLCVNACKLVIDACLRKIYDHSLVHILLPSSWCNVIECDVTNRLYSLRTIDTTLSVDGLNKEKELVDRKASGARPELSPVLEEGSRKASW